MPYSKKYNEEKYVEIEHHLLQLENLKEDKVLTISTASPEEAERLRWLFYDYFHLLGAKSLYTFKLFNSFLLVGKTKPSLSNLTATSQERDISSQLDSIIRELITSSSPRKFISSLSEDENISLTALGIILTEYSRVMEA